MNDLPPVVFVVDDDTAVREALRSLIRSVGLRVELFRSAEEFLQKPRLEGPSCLVVDVRLTGMSGLIYLIANYSRVVLLAMAVGYVGSGIVIRIGGIIRRRLRPASRGPATTHGYPVDPEHQVG